jgi:hypothetical protein
MMASSQWQTRASRMRWRKYRAEALLALHGAWEGNRRRGERNAVEKSAVGMDWRRGRWSPPPKRTIRIDVWWREDELDDLANSFMADLSKGSPEDD